MRFKWAVILEQRKRIEKMNELLLTTHNRLQEIQDKPPDTSTSEALDKRLAALESSIHEQAEIP